MITILLLALIHNIAIKISPHALPRDTVLRVTCIVDRFPDNRQLDVWLEDEDRLIIDHSQRQLDGVQADKYFLFEFKPTCEAVQATCAVSDDSRVKETATATFQVVGCEGYNQLKKGRKWHPLPFWWRRP